MQQLYMIINKYILTIVEREGGHIVKKWKFVLHNILEHQYFNVLNKMITPLFFNGKKKLYFIHYVFFVKLF